MNKICYCLLILTFFGCQPGGPSHPIKNSTPELMVGLQQDAEAQKKNPDPKSRIDFWYNKLKNPRYSKDSVLSSKIHYNIAGAFYGLNELDSLKKHMQMAWELMENRQDFPEQKVLLYSGLGNIAHAEQKIHQENYYYNQAAQLLLADTSLNVTPKQQMTIFLAAGQSCEQLKLKDNALLMNKKALALLPLLPGDINAEFRLYSQTANCYYQLVDNTDSLFKYINKMVDVYRIEPDLSKERFIADRKSTYFARVGNIDSAIFYHKRGIAIDEAEELENGSEAASVRTGNLYTNYANIAGIFLRAKLIDSAEHYLLKSEQLGKKYPGKADEKDIITYRQNMVDYLFATKQYGRAQQQQEIMIDEYRTLYEAENARAIAEMSTVYQLLAKDKSIHQLNETVGVTMSRLESNRLWLLISTLAALLSVSIVLFLYYFQKQRKLRNEKEKAELEQRLLRTQMEPHFIFNTLSALQSFVRFDEKEKTLKYLNQFGRLLRSSLELSRESQVPLNEEIETLENYLSLQQMRYDDAFSYQINIDEEEDLESIHIPPMLIQPFVENAIMHGFDSKKRDGKLQISFEIKEHTLIVRIKDNGKGISQQQDESGHKSLSTAISKERLEILARESGYPAGFKISSSAEQGTLVEITIPFIGASNLK